MYVCMHACVWACRQIGICRYIIPEYITPVYILFTHTHTHAHTNKNCVCKYVLKYCFNKYGFELIFYKLCVNAFSFMYVCVCIYEYVFIYLYKR